MAVSAVNPNTQKAASEAEQRQKEEEFQRQAVMQRMRSDMVEKQTALQKMKMDTEQAKAAREQQKALAEKGMAQSQEQFQQQQQLDREKMAAEERDRQEEMRLRQEELARAEARRLEEKAERDRLRDEARAFRTLEIEKENDFRERMLEYDRKAAERGMVIEKYNEETADLGEKSEAAQSLVMEKIEQFKEQRRVNKTIVTGASADAVEEILVGMEEDMADLFLTVGKEGGKFTLNDFVDQNGKLKGRAEFRRELGNRGFDPKAIKEAERMYDAYENTSADLLLRSAPMAFSEMGNWDETKGGKSMFRRDTEGYTEGSGIEMAQTFLEKSMAESMSSDSKFAKLMGTETIMAIDMLLNITKMRETGIDEEVIRQSEKNLRELLNKSGKTDLVYAFIETHDEMLRQHVDYGGYGRAMTEEERKRPEATIARAKVDMADAMTNLRTNLEAAVPEARGSDHLDKLSEAVYEWQYNERGEEGFQAMLDNLPAGLREAAEADFRRWHDVTGKVESRIRRADQLQRELDMDLLSTKPVLEQVSPEEVDAFLGPAPWDEPAAVAEEEEEDLSELSVDELREKGLSDREILDIQRKRRGGRWRKKRGRGG